MRGLGASMAVVAAAVIAVWALGEVMGFEIALLPTLAISLLLTFLLNAGLQAAHRPR